MREARVSIWNVRFAFHPLALFQGSNHIAECGERLVDIFGFFYPFYCLLLVIQPLAASQINEGELIDNLDLRAVLLTDFDLEYCVTPGRLLVLDRSEHLPPMKPIEQINIGFLDSCRRVLTQALNVHSTHLILFDLIGLLLPKS